MLGVLSIAGGAVGSVLAGRSARKKDQRARQAQTVLAGQQLRRQRLGQVREMQMARARGEQAAANTGTQDSSGMAGMQGAIGSTTASNISFAQSAFELQKRIGSLQASAAKSRGQQQMWGQVMSLGLQAASFGAMGGGNLGSAPAGAGAGATQGASGGFNAAAQQGNVGAIGGAGFGGTGGFG